MGKATIARRAELPMLPSEPACPAATVVEGAVPANGGVICGVMALERAKDPGLGMTPGQARVARDGGKGDVFLTLKSDPSTVERLCCGGGIPVLHDGEHAQNRATYTYCPVWQAEKWRIEQGQDRFGRVVEPEPVEMDDGAYGPAQDAGPAMGGDPWAQARRDLDLLAPPNTSGGAR